MAIEAKAVLAKVPSIRVSVLAVMLVANQSVFNSFVTSVPHLVWKANADKALT